VGRNTETTPAGDADARLWRSPQRIFAGSAKLHREVAKGAKDRNCEPIYKGFAVALLSALRDFAVKLSKAWQKSAAVAFSARFRSTNESRHGEMSGLACHVWPL